MFLLCFLFLMSIPNYAEFTFSKDLIMTVGETVTLNYAEDFNFNLNRATYGWGNELGADDPTAFSIIGQVHTYGSFQASKTYYTFDVTARKTGIYVLKPIHDRYYDFYLNESSSYTSSSVFCHVSYNVTVVDITSINLPPFLNLHIGDSYTFSPILTDSRASTTLTWQSSNPNVASVVDGTLTLKALGSTIISCTAHNGVSAQCEVTVLPLEVSSITLNQSEAELVAGEKLQLSATVLPDNATDKHFTWSSTNEAVALVSESGLVKAVGAGTCQIKATANDGSGKSASCLVTVLGNVMFCEDFGAVPSATVTLPIQLTNAEAIQGFEFKLVLPEGVSVQADGDGKLLATLTDRVSTQGLEGANQGNGVYQFVFTSTARIQGNSGAVVNIPIVVADNVAVGQYDVIVKDVELVKYGSSSQIHHSDRTATLTIKEMTLGDVNGDGRISVADAISIINYVLGRTPVSFILVAADVNGDNDITLADAVATVDKILEGGNAGARAAIRNIMSLDPQ